jgi:hypothetical protein
MTEEISLPKEELKISVKVEDIKLFKIVFAPTKEGYIFKFPLEGVKAHQTIFIRNRIVHTHLTDEEKKIHLNHREIPLDYLIAKFYKLLKKAIRPRNFIRPTKKDILAFRPDFVQFFTSAFVDRNTNDKGNINVDLLDLAGVFSDIEDPMDKLFINIKMNNLYSQEIPMGIGRIKGKDRIVIAFSEEIVLCVPISLFMKKIPKIIIKTLDLKRYFKYIKPQIKAYRKALKEKQEIINAKFEILQE